MEPQKGIYSVINAASKITDHVIVSVSGGKDSAVTLDLCASKFKRVDAFFMYLVRDLSFQEDWLQWAENKYGINHIHRVPHFMLADFLAAGSFRFPDILVDRVHINQIYNYIRRVTGGHWIAAGETISDSIYRRAMIKQSGTIDYKRGRFYPVAGFSRQQVRDYIQFKKLRVSAESEILGFSFRSFMAKELVLIRDAYPDDWIKIMKCFPLIDAEIKREEMFGDQRGV